MKLSKLASTLLNLALMLTAMPAQSNAYAATSIIVVNSNDDDSDDDGEIKSPKGGVLATRKFASRLV